MLEVELAALEGWAALDRIPSDVVVRSSHAVKATAEQWAVVQELTNLVPDANIVLRQHVLSSKQHPSPSLTVFGVLVTKRHGPFVLRREYVLGSEPAATAATT